MSAQSDTVIQVTCSDLRTVNVKTVILVKYQSSLHDFEGDKDDKDRTNTTYFHHPEFFFRNWTKTLREKQLQLSKIQDTA